MRRPRLIIILLMLPLLLYTTALSESAAGFAVSPVLPQNQTELTKSYFSILVKPGQKQTLEINITNLMDVEIQVSLESNSAFSNKNGILDYLGVPEDYVEQVRKPDFAEIVIPEEPILLIAPRGTAIARFFVDVPLEPFTGDLLGGFVFRRLPDEEDDLAEETPATGGGIQIKNEFIYCIAAHLTESLDEIIAPDLQVTRAYMGKQAGFSALVLDIENLAPRITSKAHIEAEVLAPANETPLFSFASSLSMAPASSMHYHRLLGDVELAPGEYTVRGNLSFENEQWPFELPLHIE